MADNDRDGWDPASGVGLTATEAAAARAVAGRRKIPLVRDPFAEPLVCAVGVDSLTRLAQQSGVDGESGFAIPRMVDWIAARTRFFDDYFSAGQTDGIRQSVILGAGLDSRAYRLPWLPGATVYEIDQPGVVDFKNETMDRLRAHPVADRRPVAADLRGDWAAPLRTQGFDPSLPTMWSAEGLLPYLRAEDQMQMLDEISALSSKGSRLAADTVDDIGELAARIALSRGPRNPVAESDADLGGASSSHAVARRLQSHGWLSNTRPAPQLFAAYAMPPLAEDQELYRKITVVTAMLS
ncbi:class I SAM-dependent methyltransferase [Mycolicibacterium sp. jd]|uniref:class I SAM-dependent methyltransferase n=1 Tax=unclassified Mycolicibacterium TaxID=2636767 RepID=UPI00351BAC62